MPLLERTPKGVRLTQYGRHLARHAERVRVADMDARRELRELATGRAGHLRIGTGFVLAQHLLPAASVRLLKLYPSVTLEVIRGDTDTLFPALRDGTVDIVLAAVTSTPADGFRQVPLLRDAVVVMSRRAIRCSTREDSTPFA